MNFAIATDSYSYTTASVLNDPTNAPTPMLVKMESLSPLLSVSVGTLSIGLTDQLGWREGWINRASEFNKHTVEASTPRVPIDKCHGDDRGYDDELINRHNGKKRKKVSFAQINDESVASKRLHNSTYSFSVRSYWDSGDSTSAMDIQATQYSIREYCDDF
jgi:hypothetical protein